MTHGFDGLSAWPLAVLLVLMSHPCCGADEIPIQRTTVETRYEVAMDDASSRRADVVFTRTHTYDDHGRLAQWSLRGPDGEHQLTWVGVFLDDTRPTCDHGAYWQADQAAPNTETFVWSKDGRMCDVLYASPGEKPRRQMRMYLDAHGREIYQEYFAPHTQTRYSEEIYRYDDDGNEIGRTWQRLDGAASLKTRFQVTKTDAYRRWTERQVYIDGALKYIETRTLEDQPDAMMPRPPAAAGPVDSSPEILPIRFARGVVSTGAQGENSPSFAPDGSAILFTRYDDDWRVQQGLISNFENGTWQEPAKVAVLKDIYNAAFASDGKRIIFCRRRDTDGGGQIFITQRDLDGAWEPPTAVAESSGETGSYFWLQDDGQLYFHRDGEIFVGIVRDNGLHDVSPLGPTINTDDGVEFSPWVDPNGGLLLFTRSLEGSPDDSGIFFARRDSAEDDDWGIAERLPLPYGWSASITPDGEDLVYVLDDDIVRVPSVLLQLR